MASKIDSDTIALVYPVPREDDSHRCTPSDDGSEVTRITFGSPAFDGGIAAGSHPTNGWLLPATQGVRPLHLFLFFDEEYNLCVRSSSDVAIVVAYGQNVEGSDDLEMTDIQCDDKSHCIVGGPPFLKTVQQIMIKVTESLHYLIVTPNHDLQSPRYRRKVDTFQTRAFSTLIQSTQRPRAMKYPDEEIDERRRQGFFLSTEIGRGTDGRVFRIWDVSTGQEFAEKQPLVADNYPNRKLEVEGFLLLRAQHTHIVKLLDWSSSGAASLYLEYFPAGSLHDYLYRDQNTPFSRIQCLEILRQCLEALRHLHEMNPSIRHGDISPANILLQQRQPRIIVKLADFSQAEHGLMFTTVSGNASYQAPELRGPYINFADGSKHTYDVYYPTIDIWSLGIVVAELLYGPVGQNPDQQECGYRLMPDKVRHAYQTTGDSIAYFLIRNMLVENWVDRADAARCHQKVMALLEAEAQAKAMGLPFSKGVMNADNAADDTMSVDHYMDFEWTDKSKEKALVKLPPMTQQTSKEVCELYEQFRGPEVKDDEASGDLDVTEFRRLVWESSSSGSGGD